MSEFHHVSVLLEECIEGLNIKPDGIYVDGTLGGAGHSSRIAAKLTKEGLCAVDEKKCKACGACFKMGCPAMTRGKETAPGRFQMKIDPSLCAGCKQCQQVCKFGAITRVR